jgi:hypothetical protein
MSATTGPELFREARELAIGDPGCACEKSCCIHEQVQLQRAQVLATLALAAATALGREGEGRTQPSKDRAAWFDAAAECRKAATA